MAELLANRSCEIFVLKLHQGSNNKPHKPRDVKPSLGQTDSAHLILASGDHI